MLGKKYTFETKTTRMRRLFLSGMFICVLGIGLISSFIIYIPIYARMQKGRSDGAFFQKSPDAIAVFTGDKGRISYALDFLKKNPSAKLFISGVYATNSFQTLLQKQASPTLREELQTAGTQVELDYESKNTFENVRETVGFLKNNPALNKVLIVSSDYHIMRIKLIFSHYMTEEKPEFYFDSVSSSYSDWNGVKKLLKEALKISRTFLILKVLREDVISEED